MLALAVAAEVHPRNHCPGSAAGIDWEWAAQAVAAAAAGVIAAENCPGQRNLWVAAARTQVHLDSLLAEAVESLADVGQEILSAGEQDRQQAAQNPAEIEDFVAETADFAAETVDFAAGTEGSVETGDWHLENQSAMDTGSLAGLVPTATL